MKRLTFKKPFNGMDNALKLIPESYKVDGKEFQITDGTETYDVRWDINEATVLRAENKNLISEDMKKMKHLMGFKSQDTLGNLKGEQRLNENKSFTDVWNKTKRLLNEEAGPSSDEISSEIKKELPKLINDPNIEKISNEILNNPQAIEALQQFVAMGKTNENEGLPTIGNEFIEKAMDFGMKKASSVTESSDGDMGGKIGGVIGAMVGGGVLADKLVPNPMVLGKIATNIGTIEQMMHAHNPMLIQALGALAGGILSVVAYKVFKKLKNKKKDINEAFGTGFKNEGNLEGHDKIAEMEREESDEKLDEFENKDVENLFNTMGDMSKIKTLASKINTKPEKIEAAAAYVKAIVGDNEVLQKQIARQLMNDKSADSEAAEINENVNTDGTDAELSVQIKVLSDALEYYKKEGNSRMVNELEADILQLQNELKVRMGEEPSRYDIPGFEGTMNSLNKISIRKEGDRFDEIFEDLYSEEEGKDFPDLTRDGKVTQADILKGRGVFEEDEEFIPHGTYTISNAGGYEVMLSDDGDAAKVRDAYGSDNPQTSDWLEIEYVPGEDGEMEPVIDPQGYDIPLNMVMRVNR
jgi:hypothetical protein